MICTTCRQCTLKRTKLCLIACFIGVCFVELFKHSCHLLQDGKGITFDNAPDPAAYRVYLNRRIIAASNTTPTWRAMDLMGALGSAAATMDSLCNGLQTDWEKELMSSLSAGTRSLVSILERKGGFERATSLLQKAVLLAEGKASPSVRGCKQRRTASSPRAPIKRRISKF